MKQNKRVLQEELSFLKQSTCEKRAVEKKQNVLKLL
jgi:hypothetical protein